MYDPQTNNFHERLAALEAAVRDIQRTLELHASDPIEHMLTEDTHGSRLSNRADEAEVWPANAAQLVVRSPLESTNIERSSFAVEGLQSGHEGVDRPHEGPIAITGSLANEATGSVKTIPTLPSLQGEVDEYSSDPVPRSPRPWTAWLRAFPTTNFDLIGSASFWLSKVGIVLFLFGVVFLFKYSIDRNWLDEQGRVGTGLMLGNLLLAAGLLVHRRRRHLSQVLMGGSIATYYISGYAAYQLLPGLHIQYGQIFLFMSAVTLLALILSVSKGEVVLALIGLLGGIVTPFALGLAQVELLALVVYTCLLLAAASTIYLFRGWQSMVWCGIAGGWAIFLTAYLRTLPLPVTIGYPDGRALQMGAAFLLLAFWVIPLVREVLSARDPIRWPRASLPDFLLNPYRNSTLIGSPARALSVAIPVSVLLFSVQVWGELVSKQTWGLIELVGAGLFTWAFYSLRKMAASANTSTSGHATAALALVRSAPEPGGTLSTLAYVHAMMGVAMLTLGLLSLLEGNWLLLALAAEAALLHLASRRFADGGSAPWGHMIFGGVGGLLAVRIFLEAAPETRFSLTNPRAITDLLAIALALGVSFLFANKKTALVYRCAVHAAVLGWLWRELHGFPEGDGYVMIAWAAYGLLLHHISRRVRDELTATSTSIAAHVTFEGALGLLAFRLLQQGYQGTLPMFNQHAAIDLLVIGLALASSFVVKQKNAAAIYRVAVHVGVLAWLWREAADMDGWQEQGYLMLRWAMYLLMVALVSHKIGDRVSLTFINLPYQLVEGMLGLRILGEHGGDWALLNARTGIDLLVVGLVLAASFAVQPGVASLALRTGMHVLVLGVLWRELRWLPNGNDLVVLAWAFYATCIHAVAWWRRGRASGLAMTSHVIFATSGLWLLELIAYGLVTVNADRPAVLTEVGLANLGVIVAAALIWVLVCGQRYALLYGLWLHVAILGWTWQELGLIPNGGNGYVTIAWGAYAILLTLAGLRMEGGRGKPWVYCGVGTLFLVAGKLFLIDLQYLEAVWRILLFLGFGGLFLLLSYVFQGFTKRPETRSRDIPNTSQR